MTGVYLFSQCALLKSPFPSDWCVPALTLVSLCLLKWLVCVCCHRVLEFRKTPLAVSRTLNVKKEIIPLVSKALPNTFYEKGRPLYLSVCCWSLCCFKRLVEWLFDICLSVKSVLVTTSIPSFVHQPASLFLTLFLMSSDVRWQIRDKIYDAHNHLKLIWSGWLYNELLLRKISYFESMMYLLGLAVLSGMRLKTYFTYLHYLQVCSLYEQVKNVYIYSLIG